MSWHDGMLEAMSSMVSERVGKKVTVLHYEDETRYGGGCSTCSYEYIEVEITYVDENNKTGTWTYEGSLSDLMQRLRP